MTKLSRDLLLKAHKLLWLRVMRTLLINLGNRVRQRRVSLHLSQEALSERAGLHRTYVTAVERGNRNISVFTLARLAKALDTDLPSLVNGIDTHNLQTPTPQHENSKLR